ncbi:hypothetical protein PENTCL1PPCAC_23236 [Pristionchus entomophagus]|uniref:G protein-coupled receptor n=1 Tax=Pristionchus entomophagus TaxID=358040 RepID=A0AAV5U3X1_9BILA|nr:hypothetical protein PENTCL1PPCAC_23236 [Pristionchus entomophagus]
MRSFVFSEKFSYSSEFLRSLIVSFVSSLMRESWRVNSLYLLARTKSLLVSHSIAFNAFSALSITRSIPNLSASLSTPSILFSIILCNHFTIESTNKYRLQFNIKLAIKTISDRVDHCQ